MEMDVFVFAIYEQRYEEHFICVSMPVPTIVSTQDAKPLGQYSNSVILHVESPIPNGVSRLLGLIKKVLLGYRTI